MANRLLLPLSENSKVKKDRLIETLNGIADEANNIHALYEKFFTPGSDRPTLANEIENELALIKKKYTSLFTASAEDELSKVEELDQEIAEIKEYHSKLLKDSDSIQADIEDSQNRITDYYIKLFKTYEKKDDGGQEARLRDAFQSIISFDDELNKTDVGYRAKIEKAKDEILLAYTDLLGKDKKSNVSKVDLLNKHITLANEFHEKVQTEISPFLDGQQQYISEVADDIQAKRLEVDSLLSETTVKTLAQGYREAMQIYGDPVYGKPEKGVRNYSKHLFTCSAKGLKHFAKFVGSYVLFIGPLLLIGWLFVSNGWQSILNVTQDGAVKFSGTEYIFYKLTIALPLLWVSWYGQKNISHRKRLFEEYNHKLRVVQMYMIFITQNNTYTLDKDSRIKLESTLLDTIERNPSEVYGKDETLMDKVLEILQTKWTGKAQSRDEALPKPKPKKATTGADA